MSTFEFAGGPAGRVAARNERRPAGRVAARNERLYRDPVGLGARSGRSVVGACREVRGSRYAGSLALAEHSTSGWVPSLALAEHSTSGWDRGESA